MDKRTEKMLTVLIPVNKDNHILGRTLHALVNQKGADTDWDILVVYDNSYKKRSEFIEDKRIKYIHFDEYLTYWELINKGVEKASGKWVSLIDKDYIYLDDSIARINTLIKNSGENAGCIWLLYSILRTEIVGNNKFDNELENAKRMTLEDIKKDKEKSKDISKDKYKYQKFDNSYLKTFGSMLNLEKQNGSLFMRKAFLQAGGYRKEDAPMENAFLMLRIQKQYDIYISFRKYGVFVSMDSIYKSVDELMYAVNKWINYIKEQKDICRNKSDLEYILYRYITTIIQRHRSFELKIENFHEYISEPPNLLKYILMFSCRGWKYRQNVKKQNVKWDKIFD